jgi:hypothetical protein
MKTIRSLCVLFILFSTVIFILSCKKDTTSRLTVYLSDAPADYDEVNIEVEGKLKQVQTGDGGWTTIQCQFSCYNLPSLPMNGNAFINLNYQLVKFQLRLIGDNNSIVVNGVSSVLPLRFLRDQNQD